MNTYTAHPSNIVHFTDEAREFVLVSELLAYAKRVKKGEHVPLEECPITDPDGPLPKRMQGNWTIQINVGVGHFR